MMTMKNTEKHPRIVSTPDTMFGKPRIDGTRITVEHVLRCLARGWSVKEILDQHPRLTKEDVQAAVAFAADQLAGWEPPIVDAAE
jgi:uncharacterized protein (DUF433 family)